jgi:cytochrome c553
MKTITWMIAAVALIAGCSEDETVAASDLTSSEHQSVVEAVTALDAEAGRTVAAWCGDCHGEDGVSTTRYIPHLAGQRMQYLVDGLKAYKEGLRDNPAMHTVVTSLNDQAMKNVTAYYATRGADKGDQPIPDAGTTAKSSTLAAAPKIAKWVQKCNRCHDDSGYADAGRFPVLNGQREEYLTYALHAYQNKFLRNSSMMHAMTELMGRADIRDITAYYAQRTAKDGVGGMTQEPVPSGEASDR